MKHRFICTIKPYLHWGSSGKDTFDHGGLNMVLKALEGNEDLMIFSIGGDSWRDEEFRVERIVTPKEIEEFKRQRRLGKIESAIYRLPETELVALETALGMDGKKKELTLDDLPI